MILVGGLETDPGIFLGELVKPPGQFDLIGDSGFDYIELALALLGNERFFQQCVPGLGKTHLIGDGLEMEISRLGKAKVGSSMGGLTSVLVLATADSNAANPDCQPAATLSNWEAKTSTG